MSFNIGLVVNPVAGLGGSVALKGSDNVAQQALALGAVPKANVRCQQALAELSGLDVCIYTYGGNMGAQCAQAAGLETQIIGEAGSQPSTAKDTIEAAQELLNKGMDLLVFVGGDGTARDLLHAIGDQVPVVGIPAGVKIHSGVYGITPSAAGKVIAQLVKGELVSLRHQEVRDIDEDEFRAGRVRARYYGELQVPEAHQYMQATKDGSQAGGKEIEALVLDDIAAHVEDMMEPNVRYIMGSGSTVAAVMAYLGLENTLLGIDVIENNKVIATDVTAKELLALCKLRETQLFITLIGGQGHVLGRGNQQLSPPLIKQLGMHNIHIIATKTKLKALQG
ncbi:MAG: ATP-NAD kinase family protein, partial [Gammaproteobacteria bacterium]|nr:ATP-NAD kinase family protein [Gammaproteobacteria bacterium]